MKYYVYMNRKLVFGGIILGASIVAIGVVVAALILKNNDSNSVLSSTTNSGSNINFGATDFKPYYFINDQPPAGFSLDTQSIQYEQNVLFYILKDDAGNKITISQQSVPPEFASSIPQGDEKIEASYGSGGLSLLPDRTTVNIVSNDGVFILINADVAVNIDSVKTITRSLTN